MRFPSRDTVERIRKAYPEGCRVELVSMDDVQAPPAGTRGTVMGADDTGSLMVRWDNGSGLNVIYGVDFVRKLNTVTTICYGEKHIWDSRSDAENYFLHGMMESEGAEQQRYTNVYMKLKAGAEVASDDEDC